MRLTFFAIIIFFSNFTYAFADENFCELVTSIAQDRHNTTIDKSSLKQMYNKVLEAYEASKKSGSFQNELKSRDAEASYKLIAGSYSDSSGKSKSEFSEQEVFEKFSAEQFAEYRSKFSSKTNIVEFNEATAHLIEGACRITGLVVKAFVDSENVVSIEMSARNMGTVQIVRISHAPKAAAFFCDVELPKTVTDIGTDVVCEREKNVDITATIEFSNNVQKQRKFPAIKIPSECEIKYRAADWYHNRACARHRFREPLAEAIDACIKSGDWNSVANLQYISGLLETSLEEIEVAKSFYRQAEQNYIKVGLNEWAGFSALKAENPEINDPSFNKTKCPGEK